MQHFRVGMSGESVQVGDKEAAVIVILHSYEFAQGAVIVAQMQIAGGADAAKHTFFSILIFHSRVYIIS